MLDPRVNRQPLDTHVLVCPSERGLLIGCSPRLPCCGENVAMALRWRSSALRSIVGIDVGRLRKAPRNVEYHDLVERSSAP